MLSPSPDHLLDPTRHGTPGSATSASVTSATTYAFSHDYNASAGIAAAAALSAAAHHQSAAPTFWTDEFQSSPPMAGRAVWSPSNVQTTNPLALYLLSFPRVQVWRQQSTVLLDRATLYPKSRWLFFALLVVLLAVRVYLAEGYYVVPYVLGIYLLNIMIGLLSPQTDRETDAYVLPVADPGEYRPFIRKLPETKAWRMSTRAALMALVAAFIPFLNLPVYAPVLVVYFFFLLFMTLRQQIQQMLLHGYVPFSWGKKRYGDAATGPVRHNA